MSSHEEFTRSSHGSKVISFCTVSPSYEHNPSAIWAHLMPVLQHVKNEHPQVRSLDVWSDGPTTQYRNKQNLWLLMHIAPQYFSDVTWNMFEAGHGKGPADAVGGVVKRFADSKVLGGTDIPSAMVFFETLHTATAVDMFYVDEAAIRTVSEMIPRKSKTSQRNDGSSSDHCDFSGWYNCPQYQLLLQSS